MQYRFQRQVKNPAEGGKLIGRQENPHGSVRTKEFSHEPVISAAPKVSPVPRLWLRFSFSPATIHTLMIRSLAPSPWRCLETGGVGKMSKSGTASICALIVGPLLGLSLGGSSALAAACATAPVSTYEASGFSCSVGPVTFSDITVMPTTSGGGTVTLNSFVPFSIGDEFGLNLIYSSTTKFSGGTADVAWTYNVSGVPDLIDARASLAGGTKGSSALDSLSEVLSNGTTLSLTAAGTQTVSFAPVSALHVIKDQQDFASAGSAAFSSITGNAFSVVPEPSTWAMLLLGFAGLGLVSYTRAVKVRSA
jgi:hypothetical protein